MAEPDHGEGTFDRIRRSDVAPVLQRHVAEREQFLAIIGQALDDLKILRLKRVQE